MKSLALSVLTGIDIERLRDEDKCLTPFRLDSEANSFAFYERKEAESFAVAAEKTAEERKENENGLCQFHRKENAARM